MASLTFVMAGPTTDYGYTNFGSGVTTPGYVTENASTSSVTCSTSSVCTYTFTHAVPANAKGSYAISFYGSRQPETMLPGDTTQQTVTESPFNNVIYFSVDGSPVVNRRTVVQVTNCNGCHYSLEFHGGSRGTPICASCATILLPQTLQRGLPPTWWHRSLPALGINFNLMIHRIHDGANLRGPGFELYSDRQPGKFEQFHHHLVSGIRPDRQWQHVGELLHVPRQQQRTNAPAWSERDYNGQAYVNPAPAITAACTGCHADQTTSGHALVMTSSAAGETCTPVIAARPSTASRPRSR